ncbi:hypothetical protein [Wenjunlia tyrosinilytica]|uniref:Secreted protein n=1 Tax=Wenjunlia tyrosinilytica TaxID=1544741 RepID=A0A917ZVH5_9ACTN|nr:hypothetical protein [Wenjunlia tyrosinilytica]GGO95854.1 hypothetical protein GCM10012280_53980 [Wenjunlia tyrosinilytica]
MSPLRTPARRAARAAAALLGATALTVGAATAASAAPVSEGWTETGSYNVNSLTGSQGIASFDDGSLVYRGLASIPLSLRIKGWGHVGDPDTARGHVFDAYQGGDTATSKMFAVTTPGGRRYLYEHRLDAGERLNNSFAAVSPDAQWLVSGEWGDQSRFQVFPAPLLNPSTPSTGGSLPQAGQITLDHTVRDIQGCDFVSDTRLVCSSDDSATDQWPTPKPLLQVDLPHPLNGQEVTGHVTSLGPLPQRSICSGTFESEGVDYDARARKLRALVVQPGVCVVATTVYEFRPADG